MKKLYSLYEVGGKVRDHLLGIQSKDVDYTVVMKNPTAFDSPKNAFYVLIEELISEGFEIFQTTDEALTIRAKFPEDHQYSGVADFVLARKQLGYNYASRMPIVTLGNLYDDLERRDFTVNAIALDDNSELIDPFNGQQDIKDRVLRTPQDAAVSFSNDPLRILRAFRFHVTKNFGFSDEVIDAIKTFNPERMELVSSERIREELHKMFKHDTFWSLIALKNMNEMNRSLHQYIFSDKTGIWLEPTTKQ